MGESFLFKIWTLDHLGKCTILIKNEENIYEALILKASQKLNINGEKICLLDGTLIDEDEILKLLSKETMILLQAGQIWKECDQTGSSGSILTLTDSSSSITYDVNKENISSGSNENIILAMDENSNLYWENYEIPFYKISHLSEILKKGEHTNADVNEMIRFIVNEMRIISSKPERLPASSFKIICKKIINEFPSLKDKDDDSTIIGTGDHSILYKLLDRQAYLNRPHKRKNSFPNTKKIKNSRACCPNWDPETSPSSSSSSNLESHENFEDMDPTAQFNVFVAQRKFLNNFAKPPSINELVTKWPFMKKTKYIIWHFTQLLKIEQSLEEIISSVHKKSKNISKFFKKYMDIEDENLRFEENLKLVAKHFKEDINCLLQMEVGI
ncbi:unnamed protein product [Brassicogethes aeneus]|uniref:CIDE-N domain-containing protein n=1 Tax=Brassicogethes aeneus TaxID=1431903 RepID=A0A9P0B4Q0_BRAAE|nr:unnamed protein product [Brassicogethes aeneus]